MIWLHSRYFQIFNMISSSSFVPVDTENTMDEVAEAAAYHSVGRRVAAQPDKILRVRKQDSEEFFPRNMKVKDSGLKPTETVEIIFSDE